MVLDMKASKAFDPDFSRAGLLLIFLRISVLKDGFIFSLHLQIIPKHPRKQITLLFLIIQENSLFL